MPLVARIGDSGGPHRHIAHNPSFSLHNRAQFTIPATNLEVKDGHQGMVKDIVEDIIMKCMERSPADPGTEVGLGSGCSMVGGTRPKIRPTQSDLHGYKGVENKVNSANKLIAKSKTKNSVKNIIDFFKREESVGNKVNLAEPRKPPILPTLGDRISDKKSLSSVKPKPKSKADNHPDPEPDSCNLPPPPPMKIPPPNISQQDQPPPPPPPTIPPEATLKRKVSSSILERFNLLVSHPHLPSPPSGTNKQTFPKPPPPSRRNQPKLTTTPLTPPSLKSIKKLKKLELEKEMKRKAVLEMKLGSNLKTWLQKSKVKNEVTVTDCMRADDHQGAGDGREQPDGDCHDVGNNC